MGFFKFSKMFMKQKVKDAEANLSKAIVAWDPKAASEAQIQDMSEKFKALSIKAEEARLEYNKEKLQFEEMQKLYDERKEAAQSIAEKLEGEEAPEQKAKLEEGLQILVDDLSNMAPRLKREEKEAEDAKDWVDKLDADLKEFSEKLKSARSNLKSAAREMEQAQREQQRAEEKAAQADTIAGLKDGKAFEDVIDIMNSNAEKARAEAQAAEARSGLLKEKDISENDVVAEALKNARGEDKKMSPLDKLKML